MITSRNHVSPVRSELRVAAEFTADYLHHNGILPLRLAEGTVEVAACGTPAVEVLDDLERWYRANVVLIAVDADILAAAIHRAYADEESIVELVRDLGDADSAASGLNEDEVDIRDLANQPPVVRFVNLLIREAHSAGASDIHLESTRDGLRVRFRIDGVLRDVPAPPRALEGAVISRVKLLAQMDIADRRVPQDGRIRVRLDERELDLRVATVPTLSGESVVLRLLDRGGKQVPLDSLGMPADMLDDFRRIAMRPHGILLATGPTGSGKTTTLYAALGLRNALEEKIITVEDPIEYQLEGVNQVPVNTRAGMTFGSALRSLLRQDPDVLMIGEMRDPETAEVAMQAAMTGHLVLSTLHANDAVAVIARLVDLGVEPYLVVAALEAVLAQRLVRKICADCRVSYSPDAASVALLSSGPAGGNKRLVKGSGCPACHGTGYRGRIGIFELLLVTDDLRSAIVSSPARSDRRRELIDRGFRTMRDDGWSKVQAGITTIEEVLRVTQ